MLAKPSAGVEQNVFQDESFGIEEVGDDSLALALVNEKESHVGFGALRLGQHRHFPSARRTPGGPQIDDQGLAGKILQGNRLALVIPQPHFREARALLERVEGKGAQPPAQHAHHHGRSERLA